MNDDKLKYANRIRSEMSVVEKMLNSIEKKEAVVDMTFSNGSYGCCSCQSDYLTDEEIADIKADLTKLIHKRAQARLHVLQKEFDNL